VFYDGFSDSLRGWSATRFGIRSGAWRPTPTADGIVDEYAGCDLRRWFDELEGWVLWRYDYVGIGPLIPPGYSIGSVGLQSGSGSGDTVTSFAVAGNFWRYNWWRLTMACAVHHYEGQGGYLAFHAGAYSGATDLLLDNVCLYLLSASAKLDSFAYMRDVVVTRPDVQWGDSTFAVTYRGIPMRGRNTLLVHLAVSDTARRPGSYYVNDSGVGGPNEPFLDYDEASFGWQPGTDTVSLTLKGLRDSIVLSAQELSIFCLDLDTAADPRVAATRTARMPAVGRSPQAPPELAVFDVRGRRIPPGAFSPGWASGVYLRIAPTEGRAMPVVAGVEW
jgi:hypothetical protein